MAEKDRDVLHFLWYDDISLKQPDLIILRFTRVIFGVSSSPFLLNVTINTIWRSFRNLPELVKNILQSIYVADTAFGADDEESAYNLYQHSKDILKSGSFYLLKFTTNSPSLQKRINKAEGLYLEGQNIDFEETCAKSILARRTKDSWSMLECSI